MSDEQEQYYLISESAIDNILKLVKKINQELRNTNPDNIGIVEDYTYDIIRATDTAHECDVIPRGLD